ncbi:MAG: MBL fold metallo-hydrolase [Betaproteobacteria bacterium]|nr:MBL fold metallo-hydrolase [Betaproteobacteria bacterium]
MSAASHIGHHPSLEGMTLFERGWLSCNNVLIEPAAAEAGAVLVDTSHVNHADQTVDLVRHALRGQPLALVVNTHLHSDHCGGNERIQSAFGCPVWVAPGMREPVQEWRHDRLTYVQTGQRCARFEAQGEVGVDRPLRAGGRDWEVLRAPGHDPDSVMLFDRAGGVLLSADALWENGFGVVFPEVAGEPGFDDVAAVLDLIASLPVKVVIPGHGSAFTDVDQALDRARSRLASFQADPLRHARHAVKVLIKYHVMEVRTQPLQELLAWASTTPYVVGLWERFGRRAQPAVGEWCAAFVMELVSAGALALRDEVVTDV